MAKKKDQEFQHYSPLSPAEQKLGKRHALLLDKVQPSPTGLSWMIHLNSEKRLPVPDGGWEELEKKATESKSPKPPVPEKKNVSLPPTPARQSLWRELIKTVRVTNQLAETAWYDSIEEQGVWGKQLPDYMDIPYQQKKHIQTLAKAIAFDFPPEEIEKSIAKAMRKPGDAQERKRIIEAANAFINLVKSQDINSK